jgi:uncharacterized protein YbcC (UPF0753/DUF2309 family)
MSENPAGPAATSGPVVSTDSPIDCAARAACARIAPLWPLKHFVAVNPFLGFADKTFAEASQWLDRVARTEMLMSRDFYAQQWAQGTITDDDVKAALETGPKIPGVTSVDAARLALGAPQAAARTAVVATIAETLDSLADGDRETSRTAFMIEHISRWCASYFDEGQAAWKSPWRELRPYAAWRAAMRHDRDPECMGLRNFRRTVAALPENPVDAIVQVVGRLGIPERAYEDYLFRALFDIQGWAAYARYRTWDPALHGHEDDTLLQLLAIRVAWGFALFEERDDAVFRTAWRAAMLAAADIPEDRQIACGDDHALRLLLQEAYDHAAQRRILAALSAQPPVGLPVRPAVQAAFCIDVRSEVFRRALEAQSPDVQTIGFAGFFGFPIEYVPIGRERGGAQCPVLLKPSVIVREAVGGASERDERRILGLRLARRRAARAWKAFKHSAVSSFTFVETMGLGFAFKIAGDALGLTRPVPDPGRDGLDKGVVARLGPCLEPRVVNGRETGFSAEARVAMAEAALRAMSMTQDFARLVLVVGHGSTSVNNPHASGLDCGACGGHTGEANARVAAAVLNDPGVRIGLAERGIVIPADTHFLGGLHDTTTDEVAIFHEEDAPASHRAELERLRQHLAAASEQARRERAELLGVLPNAHADRSIKARSRDWSQVRPEWGLAGNMAFIAAPRSRSRATNLKGRAFLHNYDWRRDQGFGTLELIMTAPMVVASWINLQYYASSVNNRVFGSGNKTLHNVVGALGVLEGNGGDLRPGLPWQSLHDGRRLVHEPLRLNVFIEAPIEAIDAVIARQEVVRQLVENNWVHLFAIESSGAVARYLGGGAWTAAATQPQRAA